jgi:hypothetical protein
VNVKSIQVLPSVVGGVSIIRQIQLAEHEVGQRAVLRDINIEVSDDHDWCSEIWFVFGYNLNDVFRILHRFTLSYGVLWVSLDCS